VVKRRQPMTQHRHEDRERGSALLIVVVVMLILSVTGMAIITMTEEDRNKAYSEMYTREALYAAEMGLRRGERVLLAAGSAAANSLLSHPAAAVTSVVTPSVPQIPNTATEFDIEHLGTYLIEGGAELANQPVAMAPVPSGRPSPQGFYSLYVRNNPEDVGVGGSTATNNDFLIRLVSVGWVQFGNEVHAVKILEEEYTWVGADQNPSAQKGNDAGGTGS
jgi:hypothetical protein